MIRRAGLAVCALGLLACGAAQAQAPDPDRDIVHPRVLMDTTLTLGEYDWAGVDGHGYADVAHIQYSEYTVNTAGSLGDDEFVYEGVSYTVKLLVTSDGDQMEFDFEDAAGNDLPSDARIGVELQSEAGDTFLIEWPRFDADTGDLANELLSDWAANVGTDVPVRILHLDAPDLFGPAELAVTTISDPAIGDPYGDHGLLSLLGYDNLNSGNTDTLSLTAFELEGVSYSVDLLGFGSEANTETSTVMNWEGVALDITPDLPTGVTHRLALPLTAAGTGIVDYLPLADAAAIDFQESIAGVDHTWEEDTLARLPSDAAEDGDYDDTTRTVYLTAAPGETDDATPFWQARLLPGLLGGNTAGYAGPLIQWHHKDAGSDGVGTLTTTEVEFEGVTYFVRVITFETGAAGAGDLDSFHIETRPPLPDDRGIGVELEYEGRGPVVYWLGSEVKQRREGVERFDLDGVPHDHGWETSEDARTLRLLAPGGTLPFQLLSVEVSADGRTVTLTYSEELDDTSVPDPEEFDVTAGGRRMEVTSVDVSGSAVTLTLADAVYPWDLVGVAVDEDAKTIASAGGEDAGDLGVVGPPFVANRSTVAVPLATADYGTEDLVHPRVLLDTTLTVGTYSDDDGNNYSNSATWQGWGYRAAEDTDPQAGALGDDSFSYRGVEYTIAELAVTGAGAAERPGGLAVTLQDADGNEVNDEALAISFELTGALGGTVPLGWGYYRGFMARNSGGDGGKSEARADLAESFVWNLLSAGHKLPVRVLRDEARDVYGPAKLSFEADEVDTASLGQFIGFSEDQDPDDPDAKVTGSLDLTVFWLEGVSYTVEALGFLSPWVEDETGEDSVVLSTDPDFAADGAYRLHAPRSPDAASPPLPLSEWAYLSLADGGDSDLTDGYAHYDHIWHDRGFIDFDNDVAFNGDFYDTSRSVYITRAPGGTESATAFWEADLTPEVGGADDGLAGFVASGMELSDVDGPLGSLTATEAVLDEVTYTIHGIAFETRGEDPLDQLSLLTDPPLPIGLGIGLEVEYADRGAVVYWVGVDFSTESGLTHIDVEEIPDDHGWEDSADVRKVRLLVPDGAVPFGLPAVAVSEDGLTVTLTYSEDLDGSSVPAAADFAVRFNGRPVAVSSAALSGRTVTLTLGTTATARHSVEVDYAPGTNPIRNGDSEDADAFGGRAARNGSTATVPLDSTVYGTQDMTHPRVLLDTTLTVGAYSDSAKVSGSTLNWEAWGYRAADGGQPAEGALGDDDFVHKGVEYTIVELAVTAASATDLPAGLGVVLQDSDGNEVTEDELEFTVELSDGLGGTVALDWDFYRDMWDTGFLPSERHGNITEVVGWNLLSAGHTLPVRILAQAAPAAVWEPDNALDLGAFHLTGTGELVTGYSAASVGGVMPDGSLGTATFDFEGNGYTIDRLTLELSTDTGIRLRLATTPDLPDDEGLRLVVERAICCDPDLFDHYPVAAAHADGDAAVDYGWTWQGLSEDVAENGNLHVYLTRAPGDTRGAADPFWAATLTPGTAVLDQFAGFVAAGTTLSGPIVDGPVGSLTSDRATLDGVAYTVQAVAFESQNNDDDELDMVLVSTDPDLPADRGIGLEVAYGGRGPVVYWIGSELTDTAGNDRDYALAAESGSSAAVPKNHGWETSANPRLVRLLTNDVDGTAPAVVAAEVETRTLVLTYDDALDESSVPTPTDYTVTVAGSGVAVTGVSVSGTTAVLTLAGPAAYGQTAAVSYAPGTNRLRDTAGNNAGALNGRSVDVLDETPPTLVGATVEGTTLRLIYNEALKATPLPVASDFTVTVAGSARTVSNVAISGATVTLTLGSAVTTGQTVTVSYTAGTNPIQDAAGNPAEDLSNSSVDEADTMAPTLSSTTVEGTALVLTYDEALDGTSTPLAADFTVRVAGSTRTVSGVSVSGMAVTLTLASAVTAGQAVTVAYTAGANPIQDLSGNDAANLTARTVMIVDTMSPVLRSARVGGTRLELTYSEAIDATALPGTSDFTVLVDGSARSVTAVAVSGATVTLTLGSAVTAGQTVTVSYTAGTNPIRDAAGNGADGLSTEAVDEADATPPALSGATVRGSTLVLNYDEPLDADSTPDAGDYTVTVAGDARAVSDVSVSGTAVTLTLDSAVTAGQAVTVTYAAGANPVLDDWGNAAADLSDESVTNNTASSGGGGGGGGGGGASRNAPPVASAAIADASMFLGGSLEIDLAAHFSDPDDDRLTYAAESSDEGVAAVELDGATLTVRGAGPGAAMVTATATDPGGRSASQSFEVTVSAAGQGERIWHLPPASDPLRQGFVRVVNHSDAAGEASIVATDDAGMARGPLTLALAPGQARHFNTADLEGGNPDKGLSGAAGTPGAGGWRLGIDGGGLDVEALAYARMPDGLLTTLGGTAPQRGGAHDVAFFNPGSNYRQVSLLRLVNPGAADAEAVVSGVDDEGRSPGGPVRLTVAAGTACTVDAAQLESGSGLACGSEQAGLGDGAGKWRLTVEADAPLVAMSLLESPTGHLANLSEGEPADADGTWRARLFPAASDPQERQGFVRVINRSDRAGTVTIQAFDDGDAAYEPLTLNLAANGAAHFNSDDLESGNAAKGLSGSTGPGTGTWRLALSSGGIDFEARAYVRHADGFVTPMGALAPELDRVHRLATFNPGSNWRSVSVLRLVNPGPADAVAAVGGADDSGLRPGSPVRVAVPAGRAVELTAAELESGESAAVLSGSLGDGAGKWRLRVAADRDIRAMGLLSSVSGHLANLSGPAGWRGPAGPPPPGGLALSNPNECELLGRWDAAPGASHGVELLRGGAPVAGRAAEGWTRATLRWGGLCEAGTYAFRVCAEGADGRCGPWSDPSAPVTVEEPPPPPAVIDDQTARAGETLEIDLRTGFPDSDGRALDFSVKVADPAFAAAEVQGDRTLSIRGLARGSTTVTVTAADASGTTMTRTFRLTVRGPALVPLFPSAADELGRQGFVRVVDRSGMGGEVTVEAIDDTGASAGTTVLALPPGGVGGFNSDDLEGGNPGKGLSAGVGSGQGDWRLRLDGDFDFEVLAYVRSADGLVTSMHDLAPVSEGAHRIATFNPGSNYNQVSRLRLVNRGDGDAAVSIAGVDDQGASPGTAVAVDLPAGTATTLTSADLESGAGVEGALGDGTGKWRLSVTADGPLAAMSLLSSPTGHLSNLSAPAPPPLEGAHLVPFLPSASDALGRKGFVRVANRSGEAGSVRIEAHDDEGLAYEALTLALEAGHTAHFNSDDLELGNAAKGLEGSTGSGSGDWRLSLTSDLDIEVLAYVRTADGFLTSMHEVAPLVDGRHWVAFFNPGSNSNQVSLLRLVNPGEAAAEVTITGVDDAGASAGGEVRATVPAGGARTLTAAALESGEGVDGALGDGSGKWRLTVASDVPILVMSLLSSPTGHVTDLSSAPDR